MANQELVLRGPLVRNIQAFRVPSEGKQTSLPQRAARACGPQPSVGLPTKAHGRGMRQPGQAFPA